MEPEEKVIFIETCGNWFASNRIAFLQKKLEVLVGYMGGRCTPQLTAKVNYLITENIFTKKYEVSKKN